MKKLLLMTISLFSVFTLQAQQYAPTGSINAPTWFYQDVIANDGDYLNSKTGKNGSCINDASLYFTTTNSDDAYDGAFEFFVNTRDSVYTESGNVDTTNTLFTLEEQLIDGFYVSKSYYFSPTEPVVRALFKIRNASGTAKSTKIGIFTNFGSDDDTQLDSSASGGGSPTNADRWMITSDGEDGGSDPINTSVRFGPGGVASSPVFGYAPAIDEDDFLDTFAISVPANSYSLILQFNRLDTTVAAAKANAYKFNTNAALKATDYLNGLSESELNKIVNWNFSAATTTVQNITDVSNQVTIFPVPATQNITVSLSNSFEGKTTFKVKDVTGVTFLNKEFSKSGGTSYESVDVSSLEPGMYILEIKNNDKVAYKKLIKN